MLAAGMVAASSAGSSDAARAAIESQSLALMEASKRGDAAAMAAVFTADARLNVPGPQGIIAGRAAIQRFWESALNGGMQELSLAAVELEGDGELRFETGAYSARGANGAVLGTGEYLLVWKKEGGAWRIYRDYGRPAAPAAVSAAPRVVPSGGSGYPANYQAFAALGSAFNERSSEVTTTFVNPTAAGIERTRQLPYPDATVFVMEFASARRDGEAQLLRDSAGEVLKGEILHVDVMRKRGAGERAAGVDVSAWEFTSYRSDGSVAIAPADAAHCADCHRNAGEERDFVFRTRAPLAR